MKIIDKRVYTGKNIYSHKLCIRLTVDVGELYDTPSKDIKGFNEKLLIALPGMKKHKCSLGYVGGFCDRLTEGTYLPHILEHMLIEMQNVLGYTDIKYGKARCVEKNIYQIVYEYEFEEAALICAEVGISCINNFINEMNFDMKLALENIEKRIAQKRIGPSTKGIYEEAKRRDIPVIRIGKDSIFQLGYGVYQKRISATLTSATSCIGVDISCDKELTREVLKYGNIPITLGDVAENIIGVLKLCKKIGYPIVIKPINGCKGKGVTVNINNENEAIEAYNEASRINTKVLVEKYIEGNDYRILVVNDCVVAVTQRMPPWVTGDGIHTIMDLIETENEDPLRGYDHEKPLTKIIVDDIMINYLKRKGLNLAYIPDIQEKVVLRFNANLSTGGVARDCTDIIHRDNCDIAVQAAKAVGLDIAGIDVCSKDISKSLREIEGCVLEVNSAPGIRMHMYPNYGKSRNVASNILDYLFGKDKKAIPVVAVSGTNGKTTVTRMIAHIMSCSGLKVGMTTTGGVYIGEKLILKGDTTGSESAKMVLMDNGVEGAVLETARGGIIKRGLGYDCADVGVITNISEDHLGIDGIETIEELISVKSLVLEAIKDNGFAIINADDVNSNSLYERVKSKIMLFSTCEENTSLKKHMDNGGSCVFTKDGYICHNNEGVTERIVEIKDIPATMNGILAYNIENALAATSACLGINMSIENISKGLRSFFLDDTQNPGRFNVYNVENFKVVVDYGHNIEAYRAVINSLDKLDKSKLIGIIGVPGDRNNDSIIGAGKLAGEGFDYIFIKEDEDRRGREIGEVAKLLLSGVKASGKTKLDYKIILNEGEALKYAMEKAGDNDVIVVFYENYKLILETIEEFKNRKPEEIIKGNVV